MQTTPRQEDRTVEPAMYVAFELSNEKWKLGIGYRGKTRIVDVAAGAVDDVLVAMTIAKHRLEAPETVSVFSCYEAGRDGFWLHRWLVANGLQNRVVDSSSIEVNRRARRAKTDRLDVLKLLSMLMRDVGGEKNVWRAIRVPTVEQEDGRRPQRELLSLQEDEGRLVSQIRSVLKLFGVPDSRLNRKLQALDELRSRDGAGLPRHALQQLQRLVVRLKLVRAQIKEIENQRRELVVEAVKAMTTTAPADRESSRRHDVGQQVFRLMALCGVGVQSSWLCVTEFFAWRDFKNRREVAGAAGLTPVPYDSGAAVRSQGLSRSGNRRVRSMMVLIAWGWLRHQPESELSRWFVRRFGTGKVSRKKGIVALARRLLIALWRYLKFGEVPAGARLKPAIALG